MRPSASTGHALGLGLTFAFALTLGLALAPTPARAAPGKRAGKRTRRARRHQSGSNWTRVDAALLLRAAKDPLVRESAALVLGRRGARAAVPLLVRRLKADKNPWVRAAVAEALGRIGDGRAKKPLAGALAREKRQRVRRAVALALLRLGVRAGLLELMWQLEGGTNHSRADAMRALVAATGRPLGQDAKAWWSYFAARGYKKLAARRVTGAPKIVALRGRLRVEGRGAPTAKRPWRVLPAVVVRLGPRGGRAITAADLARYERRFGRIPDRCLVLLERSRAPFQEKGNAAAAAAAATRRELARAAATRRAVAKGATGAKNAGARAKPGPVMGAGLTAGALTYLLKRAPALLGVGIDAPALDVSAAAGAARPVRARLLAAKKIVLRGAKDFARLNASGTRLVLVRVGTGGAALALAFLP